ncbi:hypothetical protein D3C75_1102090 [compost metagenome]
MMRIRHNRLGQQHHGARRVGIHFGVTQRAAAGFAAVAIGITELIAGRYPKEGDVDAQFAGFDQVDPAAVGVDLHRFGQQAA